MRTVLLNRWRLSLAVVVLVVASSAAGWLVWRENAPAHAANIPPVVQDFGHQKVVYHIAEAGNGREAGWLGSMLNHYAALKPGALDMAVVLNGDGIELLQKALHDKLLQERITKLKSLGARFLVCRNTLVWKQLDPEKDLYDVHTGDIVAAGVAEVGLLEAQGYGYIRP